MKTAIIGYPSSKNLGDWIQSLVIEFIWNKKFQELDREQLHAYCGPKVKLICNGWFLENPKHWPPSEAIFPLFISFHINPTAKKELTSPKSIAYLKNHEPIGCRDLYTQNLLKDYGIKTYFSGCLTLCYQKSFFDIKESSQGSGVLVASALDRLKPSIENCNNLINFFSQLLKFPIKFWKYKKAVKRLNKALSTLDKSVTYISQTIELANLKNEDPKNIATQYLHKIASAQLIITSRIHTALPATAMNIPVLFLNDGLNHINHKSRLSGLSPFFTTCSTKEMKHLNLNSIMCKSDHFPLINPLKKTISLFMD
ncbi:MAG: polysaccharide pyruvyl transferase family protein [Flavobacteriaceae bacterium]|nr:polysaccharide pyruvyl transferase family protein [Flavobacteriaceae bacterium]